ncbi:hypothetical protein BDV93DRAFT_509110 [Ceratobasidium sp. AG-I]|nr:hypothetical protein BDV93DRAFT_509110 [Ceratobasidium sp. AG-I]
MGSAGLRNFTGNKLTLEIVNLMLLEMRRIVGGDPALAHYGGYFFHILGINLKSFGQQITGHSHNNLMLHIFHKYPTDILLNIGFEIIDPKQLPASCYQKDNKQTYLHGDCLIGTGFLASDVAGNMEKYQREMLWYRVLSCCDCRIECQDSSGMAMMGVSDGHQRLRLWL